MNKSLTISKAACQTVVGPTGDITSISMERLEIVVPCCRIALKSYDLTSLPETFSISTSAAKPDLSASQ